jgi:hypothetical protein
MYSLSENCRIVHIFSKQIDEAKFCFLWDNSELSNLRIPGNIWERNKTRITSKSVGPNLAYSKTRPNTLMSRSEGPFSAQSTYIYRAPQRMSHRRNWDSPNPSPASGCALPPGPKGGGAHSPAAKGVGDFQFRRLKKKLSTLPTLLFSATNFFPKLYVCKYFT